MIIQELINCGKATAQRLRQLESADSPNNAEIVLEQRKIAALRELQNYALTGNWTRRSSLAKYAALIKSKFNYALIARRFNTTRESLDVFAARQNKRLTAVIGEALHLIEQNRIDEGLDSFYALSGAFSLDEFNYRPLELLGSAERKDGLLVSDCTEEAELLRTLIKSEVIKRISAVDGEKLSYLLFLLSTDVKEFAGQKRELTAILRKR